MFSLFCIASIALAENTNDTGEESDGTIIVEDKKNSRDQIGSVSLISVEDAALMQADLGELLSQQPSINIRRFGGMGAYSSISVRGASSEQTTIMINGIPLNPEGSSSVNLSDLPLGAFSTIELYRSHVPLHLQSSSIGGVVNLLPNTDPQQRLSLGGGSFESLTGDIFASTSVKEHNLQIFARHFQTEGDFEFFSTKNTPFNTDDDSYKTRQNNASQQQNIFVFDSWKNISLLHNSHLQRGGLAGSINMELKKTSLQTSRHLSSAQWMDVSSLFSHQIDLWHLMENYQLDDRGAEIFGGQQWQRQQVQQLGIRGHHQLFYSDHWIPSLGWTSRWEDSKTQNLLQNEIEIQDNRLISQLQIGSQFFFLADRLEENSALQIYHFHTQEEDTLFLAPKTSILFRYSDQFLAWSSANRSFRPPTMLELHGNQGSMIGNPDLQPETAHTFDTGILWKRNEHMSIQSSYFHRWGQDSIILIQNAQKQSIPKNFTKIRVQGIEQVLNFRPNDWLAWTLGLTWTHSQNLSNIEVQHKKKLPNVPIWNLENQIKVEQKYVSLQYNWSFTDQNYTDATNYYLSPSRSIHNIEFASKLKNPFPEFSFTIRNLTNSITEETLLEPRQPNLGTRSQAISDFIGYPLSGRQIFFTATWNAKKL